MTLGKMILRRKKAVSPVIATILLIALTVTAAAIVYFVVVPLLQKKPELVIVSPAHVTGDNSQIQFTIQNIGTGEASLDPESDFTLYYSNSTGEGNIPINVLDNTGTDISDTITISSQGETTIIFDLEGDTYTEFATGTTYTIGVSDATVDYTY